jgi:hypothetical protein
MTRKADFTSTFNESSNWFRKQERLDSKKGYVYTDLDIVWCNYKLNKYMLLETKKYVGGMTPAQYKSFMLLDKTLAPHDENYYGFHLIQYENTCPEDGNIRLDGSWIELEDFYEFLEFKKDRSWYKTRKEYYVLKFKERH